METEQGGVIQQHQHRALGKSVYFGAIDTGSDGGQSAAAGPLEAKFLSVDFQGDARSAAQTTPLRQGMH